MPEGSFTVLANGCDKSCLAKVASFLEEHVSDLEVTVLKEGYTQISSDSMLEFHACAFLAACKPNLNQDAWIRVYSNDEYGTEGFWYVDKSTEWMINLNDEDQTDSFVAYRKWHDGLDDSIRYGYLSDSDLQEMEEKYGSFDDNGHLILETNATMQLDSQPAEEKTAVLKVRNASKQWNWYIADHASLATKIAAEHLLPPDSGQITFRRTFKIKDCLGYVFSWLNNGVEVYVVFRCFGKDMHDQRGFVNTKAFSLDEVINFVCTENYSAVHLEYPEGCMIYAHNEAYLHTCLDAIDDGPFHNSRYSSIFEGKVLSCDYVYLTRKKGKYYLSQDKLSQADGPVFEIADPELDGKLENRVPKAYASLGRGLYCKAKVVMGSNEVISELLGIELFKLDRKGGKVLLDEWKIDKAIEKTTIFSI